MDQQGKIAILFFSRSADCEASHKKWLKEKGKANSIVARKLITTTKSELSQTGLPVFHIDESQQKGNSFGEKLANAYQKVFDLGFEGVIGVGNDAAGLSNINWSTIIRELSTGRNVLGPDFRKGAYLIGLTKKSFYKKSFEALPWQTGSLFDCLLNYCETPVLLPKLRDINTRFDLMIVSKTDQVLKKLIRLITRIAYRGTELPMVFTPRFSPAYKSLRAPPFS